METCVHLHDNHVFKSQTSCVYLYIIIIDLYLYIVDLYLCIIDLYLCIIDVYLYIIDLYLYVDQPVHRLWRLNCRVVQKIDTVQPQTSNGENAPIFRYLNANCIRIRMRMVYVS